MSTTIRVFFPELFAGGVSCALSVASFCKASSLLWCAAVLPAGADCAGSIGVVSSSGIVPASPSAAPGTEGLAFLNRCSAISAVAHELAASALKQAIRKNISQCAEAVHPPPAQVAGIMSRRLTISIRFGSATMLPQDGIGLAPKSWSMALITLATIFGML